MPEPKAPVVKDSICARCGAGCACAGVCQPCWEAEFNDAAPSDFTTRGYMPDEARAIARDGGKK